MHKFRVALPQRNHTIPANCCEQAQCHSCQLPVRQGNLYVPASHHQQYENFCLYLKVIHSYCCRWGNACSCLILACWACCMFVLLYLCCVLIAVNALHTFGVPGPVLGSECHARDHPLCVVLRTHWCYHPDANHYANWLLWTVHCPQQQS